MMKTILLNFTLALVTALVTALLVLTGSHYLQKKNEEGASPSFFSSSEPEKEKELQFVEIKNLVITLKSHAVKERYLLLDLALTTDDESQVLRAENLLPKIKGIAVDMLTSMDYNEVRSMSVLELRSLMMTRYHAAFKSIGVTIPFSDVTISKMVFQ